MQGLVSLHNLMILLAWTPSVTSDSHDECQSFDFLLPLTGRYCAGYGKEKRTKSPNECRVFCLHSWKCNAFNYNHTAGDCILFSSTCTQAIADPVMEYGIFTPLRSEAKDCYEWRPIDLKSWERAVIDNTPTAYATRMLIGGKYVGGFYGETHHECYASEGHGHLYGYPCESLWIKNGCTAYSLPHVLGEPVHPRAVIVGTWLNGDIAYVASVTSDLRNPGYYVAGFPYAQSPFYQSTNFNILVIL